MAREASTRTRSSTLLSQTKHPRRTILKAVAASAAAMGLMGSGRAFGSSAAAANGIPTGTRSLPVIAYVSDAQKGEIVVMVGTREVVRRDAGLVARLVAIAKEAGDVVAS
jgi:hypothetical protein